MDDEGIGFACPIGGGDHLFEGGAIGDDSCLVCGERHPSVEWGMGERRESGPGGGVNGHPQVIVQIPAWEQGHFTCPWTSCTGGPGPLTLIW